MPAPSTLFHQRRLFHGAGECLAIGPVAVPWAEAGSLGGVSGEAAKRLPDPRRLYPWDIAPWVYSLIRF